MIGANAAAQHGVTLSSLSATIDQAWVVGSCESTSGEARVMYGVHDLLHRQNFSANPFADQGAAMSGWVAPGECATSMKNHCVSRVGFVFSSNWCGLYWDSPGRG
jgi:hypothetical protein